MKKIIISLSVVLASLFIGQNSFAQVIIVKPKHSHVIVKKTANPHAVGNWVWMPGHWKWKKKSNKYVWIKARWVKAPKKYRYWNKGHWKKVKNGWKWMPGHWL